MRGALGNGTHDRAWSLAMAALLLVLAACDSSVRPSVDDSGEAVGGTEADATNLVIEWLEKARTGTDDLGWSLLYPNVRTDLIGSEDAYRAAIESADWSGFEYIVGDTQVEDGEYRVPLRIPGGASSVPEPMQRWGLIQFGSIDGLTGSDAFMTVRIDPAGFPFGIQATG